MGRVEGSLRAAPRWSDTTYLFSILHSRWLKISAQQAKGISEIESTKKGLIERPFPLSF